MTRKELLEQLGLIRDGYAGMLRITKEHKRAWPHLVRDDEVSFWEGRVQTLSEAFDLIHAITRSPPNDGPGALRPGDEAPLEPSIMRGHEYRVREWYKEGELVGYKVTRSDGFVDDDWIFPISKYTGGKRAAQFAADTLADRLNK